MFESLLSQWKILRVKLWFFPYSSEKVYSLTLHIDCERSGCKWKSWIFLKVKRFMKICQKLFCSELQFFLQIGRLLILLQFCRVRDKFLAGKPVEKFENRKIPHKVWWNYFFLKTGPLEVTKTLKKSKNFEKKFFDIFFSPSKQFRANHPTLNLKT